MFDGLDMHLYTLVATPFVAELMITAPGNPSVARHGAYINAGFLAGWAVGGVLFGRLGDRLGRSRTLSLTVLTYAAFTGLSALSGAWWHLLIFRFLSALGIGGEWAVGASLLAETWPRAWRPWLAATLQTAVNVGVLFACVAGFLLEGKSPRWLFVVGICPALLVLWMRRAVPETAAWAAARKAKATNGTEKGSTDRLPGLKELFRSPVARVTWPVLILCAVALSGHWTFMFWQQAHLRSLPEVRYRSPSGQNHVVVIGVAWLMVGSILGNYLAGGFARWMGYRKSVVLLLALYGGVMAAAFSREWNLPTNLVWFLAIGVCQGVFGLFTMCLPPLFPVLLRTTGAGFCYNAGRLAAAFGTVYFGVFARVNDYRHALLYASSLFAVATVTAVWMPEVDENA